MRSAQIGGHPGYWIWTDGQRAGVASYNVAEYDDTTLVYTEEMGRRRGREILKRLLEERAKEEMKRE